MMLTVEGFISPSRGAKEPQKSKKDRSGILGNSEGKKRVGYQRN
jgi:hypothetical protein